MNAKIGLKDVRIHAPHGFFEEEHYMGNEFSIDVEVDARIGGAASQDDLGQTVNYATIHYLLKAEMKRPTQLLEALAYRMAARIAEQFDNVDKVKLRLHKLNPPLGGKVAASWVEVEVTATAGYGGGLGEPRTFEDNYEPHYDKDGPFASRTGGGTMTGAPLKPRPVLPQQTFDPPTPPPPALPAELVVEDNFEWDDEAFGDEAGHAVSDDDFHLEDFELPDDFDMDSLPDFDALDFDFGPDDPK
ncbi:dihydroneopterin aldolase [Lewinella sp. 4G2]|uniref:dihydroneopterin aldolase n=1 Tax=Lewinella sp. 4G2 TaxID=1803372 RepID=UPI0007B4960D|nr:dihydroneopterin aldolase [Lewinella sp. 4G2]OAV45977.1 dihydroneopterin aldolase [Lewinella sp. 4G2]